MRQFLRKAVTHPALSIGSVVLWGLFELIALQRSHRADK
jgi:hypothetical protein